MEEQDVRAVVSMNEDYELKWLSNMHEVSALIVGWQGRVFITGDEYAY